MALGDLIRDARKEKGLSQKDLAARLRNRDGEAISPQYLNEIELNRRVPPSYLLDQIAHKLEIDADALHLMSGQVPPNVRPENHPPEKLTAAMKAFRQKLR